MNWRRILTDPGFWALLLVNVLAVRSFLSTPEIFTTLVWLYLSQSVLYGLFNFLDMITSRGDLTGFTLKGNKPRSEKAAARFTGFAFLLHFGFFHFVYFIFLLSMEASGPFDWKFYKLFLAAFAVVQLFSFIQHKIHNKGKTINLGRSFFLPYLRIIPMHLYILLPAFFQWSNLTVFLVLKVITDMIGYALTTTWFNVKQGAATSVEMEAVR